MANQPLEMHRVEQFILTRLIEEPRLRYSELKPDSMEGSLFTYHLRGLIKQDLVKKDGNWYALTSKGKLYADKLHLETLEIHQQPRIVVLVAVRDDKKGWLLFRRRTQPVINMIGFPHVNINLGTKLVKNAEAEFLKNSGLKVSLGLRGNGYITMYRDNEPESYIFCHLLYGQNPSGELIKKSDLGEHFWEVQPNLSDPNVMPSMGDLLKKLEQPVDKPFFVELEYHLKPEAGKLD